MYHIVCYISFVAVYYIDCTSPHHANTFTCNIYTHAVLYMSSKSLVYVRIHAKYNCYAVSIQLVPYGTYSRSMILVLGILLPSESPVLVSCTQEVIAIPAVYE